MRKALIFALVALAAFATAGEPIKAKVSGLSWMAGAWSCPKWGGTFEEHWTAHNGGTMLSVGRLISKGKTDFMEFMSLEPEGDGVTMWITIGSPAKKEDRKTAAFRLTSLKGKQAVFECPENDFPSKITYHLQKDGSLFCRIEGGGRKDDFPFKKIKPFTNLR